MCFYTRTFDKEAGCSSDKESHNLETERKKERKKGGESTKGCLSGDNCCEEEKVEFGVVSSEVPPIRPRRH